jgi:hypothetical protein
VSAGRRLARRLPGPVKRAARKLASPPGGGGAHARADGAAGRGAGARRGGGAARKRKSGRGAPRPQDALVRGVARGQRLDDAVIAQVRSLLAAGDTSAAQALAASLRAQPGTETLGRVATGIVALKQGYRALAWEELRVV